MLTKIFPALTCQSMAEMESIHYFKLIVTFDNTLMTNFLWYHKSCLTSNISSRTGRERCLLFF